MNSLQEIRRDLETYADEIGTLTDLQNLYGVSVARINNWTMRYEDFPLPLLPKGKHFGRKNVYIIKEVEEWMNSRGILCSRCGRDLAHGNILLEECPTCDGSQNYYEKLALV